MGDSYMDNEYYGPNNGPGGGMDEPDRYPDDHDTGSDSMNGLGTTELVIIAIVIVLVLVGLVVLIVKCFETWERQQKLAKKQAKSRRRKKKKRKVKRESSSSESSESSSDEEKPKKSGLVVRKFGKDKEKEVLPQILNVPSAPGPQIVTVPSIGVFDGPMTTPQMVNVPASGTLTIEGKEYKVTAAQCVGPFTPDPVYDTTVRKEVLLNPAGLGQINSVVIDDEEDERPPSPLALPEPSPVLGRCGYHPDGLDQPMYFDEEDDDEPVRTGHVTFLEEPRSPSPVAVQPAPLAAQPMPMPILANTSACPAPRPVQLPRLNVLPAPNSEVDMGNVVYVQRPAQQQVYVQRAPQYVTQPGIYGRW